MKIAKKQLENIILEEIEATLSEQNFLTNLARKTRQGAKAIGNTVGNLGSNVGAAFSTDVKGELADLKARVKQLERNVSRIANVVLEVAELVKNRKKVQDLEQDPFYKPYSDVTASTNKIEAKK